MGINALAALWGLAEATVFFIVPDVWLSAVGLRSLRKGLIACLYALAGALVGGLLMYAWGMYDEAVATRVVEIVPAISPDMMTRVQADLKEQGVVAILFGPLSGTPYKTYAVQAGGTRMGISAFLLISIPARLVRFVAVTFLAYGVGQTLLKHWPLRHQFAILALVWVTFYAFYFSAMAN